MQEGDYVAAKVEVSSVICICFPLHKNLSACVCVCVCVRESGGGVAEHWDKRARRVLEKAPACRCRVAAQFIDATPIESH